MAKTAKAGAPARSFAHLLGMGGHKAAKGKAEETEEKPKDDKEAVQESDTDDDGETDCPECDGTGKDDDGDECEACEGTGEVGDGAGPKEKPEGKPKGKKAKADMDDDDDEAKKATKAERSRWTKVLGHTNAGEGRVAAAVNLLATTEASAASIIGTLGHLPSASASRPGDGLYSRMNAERVPNPGAGPAGKASTDDFGAQVAAAVGKVRPVATK
jgi:hypothetical protein